MTYTIQPHSADMVNSKEIALTQSSIYTKTRDLENEEIISYLKLIKDDLYKLIVKFCTVNSILREYCKVIGNSDENDQEDFYET
jgi:hypothetical protein